MMKTIGILTTYFASNFGAALQPYALKRTLESMGYDVEILRYAQPVVYRHYNPFNALNIRRCISKNPFRMLVAFLWTYPLKCIKELKFRKYIRKYINNKKGFEKVLPKNKDYYFIGSDQLWRPQNTGGYFDDIYFGNFETKANAKKISYAVSGEAIDYSKENVLYLRQHLKNFDFISVREQKLANELRDIVGCRDVSVTVDPTLLCNPDIFNEIKSKNPCPNKKFVLFYQIRNSQKFLPKIYQYARSMNAELVIFSSYVIPSLYLFTLRNLHSHYFPTASEDLFLGAMKHAEAVFTPSFHGNVFAILNHRDVYDLILDDGHDTRAKELFENLGISNHFLRINDEIVSSPIDYEQVEQRLQMMRNSSMNFIRQVLHD